MKRVKSNRLNERDHEVLFEELEKRYGAAVAQGIIDQIKRVEGGEQVTDYMVVKAFSETMNLFRGEAQGLLHEIRGLRERRDGTNLRYMEERRLETEFKRIFRLYWISMKLFYPLYGAALTAARQPKFPTREASRQASGDPLCRRLAA